MEEVFQKILTEINDDPRNLCTYEELELSMKQCLVHFDEADNEGDGSIGFEELKVLTHLMGLPVSVDEEETLAKMDTDDTGTLERDEWARWWLTRISRLPNPGKQQEAIARNTFRKFDADRSGSINVDEFDKLVEYLGMDFSPSELKEAVAELDSDASGQIEESEFVDWWCQKSKRSSGGLISLKVIDRLIMYAYIILCFSYLTVI